MKNAIVTGGTRGIGLAAARMLMQEGYFVHLTWAASETHAQAAENELSTIGPHFELHRVNQVYPDQIHTFARQLGDLPLHCIVCNAGTTVRKPTPELTDEDWNQVMQVNVNGHFFLLRDLWKNIQANARIVFIGSTMGLYPHAVSLPYGVTKAALHAMAKNLVKDFAGTGTTVNVIAPGFVDTEWQKSKPQHILDNIYAKTACNRLATVEEVTDTLRFVLRNGFVNGAILEVNGGYCYK